MFSFSLHVRSSVVKGVSKIITNISDTATLLNIFSNNSFQNVTIEFTKTIIIIIIIIIIINYNSCYYS